LPSLGNPLEHQKEMLQLDPDSTGSIPLSPGKISVKEFTPQKVGRYKFSCWMGMVSGTIKVIDGNDSVKTSAANNTQLDTNASTVPSGSTGCNGCSSNNAIKNNSNANTNNNNNSDKYNPPSSSSYSCH